jgi:antitoxin (DNA-binding transcriptional repressor) of toxin-antitoxin stability system
MASNPIDLKHAQDRLKELVEKAGRGDEVVLEDGGRAVAKIIAFEPRGTHRRFGSARGLIHVGADFDAPLEDFKD